MWTPAFHSRRRRYSLESDEGRVCYRDRVDPLEKYSADGNEVVEFKLVRMSEDLSDSSISFNPDMCHQIFKQSGQVFGYENLHMKLYFTAGSLCAYLGIQYKSKVPEALADGVEPDNLTEKLGGVLRAGYTTNFDDFSASVEKSQLNFKPCGELIHSFTVEPRPLASEKVKVGATGVPGPKTYEVYYCDVTVSKFKEYLQKMETFILWFLDAGSYVDGDDEHWKFFVLFEKYKSSEGNSLYSFVGYSSVYEFNCFPEMIRPRVVQMIILPPFQRQGLAAELLSTIYRTYRIISNTKEITVGRGSEEFERVRDFIDARDCSKLSSYSNEKLKGGFSKEMSEEAKKTLKMTNRQAQRVYEMLRLRVTNLHNEGEFKEYRVDVKKRLNIPYQKQQSYIKRMMRLMKFKFGHQSASQLNDAVRKAVIRSSFSQIWAHYNLVIERMSRDC